MPHKREDIVETLRARVLGALSSGAMVRGDRLPSTRELAAELDADPRVVLAAYRVLAADGLVELRTRSGIYVAASPRPAGVPILSAPWLVDVLAQAVARDVPALDAPRWLRLALESVRLRAVVVAPTIDQVAGMVGELRESFGVDAFGIDTTAPGRTSLTGVKAEFVVTVKSALEAGRAVGATLGAPVIVVAVREDLIGNEWRALLATPVYVIVCDARFGRAVEEFFRATPGAHNLRVLVAGRDDLSTIEAGAPVYFTRAARDELGDHPIPGRAIEPARIFDGPSVRAILDVIVRANLAALERRTAAEPV